MQNKRPRILSIDIETAPLEVYAWGLWKQNVGLNQIITEWSLLSYCAKWLDSEEVIYNDNRGRRDPRDDKKLIGEIWKLLDEADIVIAQNGQKFDLRKIRARMVLLGFKPFSPIKLVDTMLECRKAFAFTSNKLEWLTNYLSPIKKSKHAKFPGFELWAQCLAGNPEAWDEMREYNIPDVLGMEQVYLTIRPWIEGHPNVAAYADDEDRMACPKCGSHSIVKKGYHLTQTGKYHRIRCRTCGGWSRTRYTVNTKAVRKNLLSN